MFDLVLVIFYLVKDVTIKIRNFHAWKIFKNKTFLRVRTFLKTLKNQTKTLKGNNLKNQKALEGSA